MEYAASPYIIAAIVAIIIGSYVWLFLRKSSFVMVTIVANFLVFLVYAPFSLLDPDVYGEVVRTLADRSLTIVDGEQLWGLFTHMYMHGGVIHLAFNMIVLMLFGLPFEDRIGRKNVAIVYLVTGVLGGAILYSVFVIPRLQWAVGASSAISGILGAFAVMYPRDRIMMPLGFIIVPNVPVAIGALVFIGFQTVLMFFAVRLPGIEGQPAYLSHLAALVVGVGVGFVMLKIGVEAPTFEARARKRMGKLDLDALAGLATTPSLKAKYEALVGEDISEVKEVLLEDFVSRARCPQCDSILEIKGHRVECAKGDWRLEIKQGRG
jgi:membrane associated rhomboid family serine protease